VILVNTENAHNAVRHNNAEGKVVWLENYTRHC